MVSGSIIGPSRPSSSYGSSYTRGNSVPLNIPRNNFRDTSGKSEPRPSFDSFKDPSDYEPRSSLNGRYQSPNRFASESVSGSLGTEGTSPFSSLKRPVDRRRLSVSSSSVSNNAVTAPSSLQNAVRKEGFAPKQSFPSIEEKDRDPSGDSWNNVQSGNVPASPSKPGLLSRTISSNMGNLSANSEALKMVQEKLENCLGSRPSLGQDVDGESLSQLRTLQAKYPVFNSATVGVAYNIASFSYNDKERDRLVMKQCVKTAVILADLGADESAVAAALLKDILLQSMMTEEQLRPLLPKDVADLVVKVGRLDDICQVRQQMAEASVGTEIDSQTSRRINHLLMTLADHKGVLVKLADRLAALQIASRDNAPNLLLSAKEALEVFAPIANRLGVWGIKAGLEDLAFKALHPSEHCELNTRLKESRDRGAIESALDDLSKVLQEKRIGGVDLSGRPKNLYGVMKKMQDKSKGLDQVYDVRALRVIVQSKNDCYAVLREVYNMWPEVRGCFKDYIRNPKANGYQSLHTVVRLPDGQPMEVQIRTDKMHFIAEYGVAAHWRYKEKDIVNPSQSEEQQVNWARWLISWSLELNDRKVRPKGSPSNDSAMAVLANQICSFPTHKSGCKFAAWASSILPRPITEEQLAERPIMAVCVNHTNTESNTPITIKEFPPKSTVKEITHHLGVAANSHILVNMVEAYDDSQILANGDRIEIFPPMTSHKLSRDQLEQQRERLSKLFGRSPAESSKSSSSSKGRGIEVN